MVPPYLNGLKQGCLSPTNRGRKDLASIQGAGNQADA